MVKIFDLRNRELLQEIPVKHRPHRAVFSPDGTRIAISSPAAPTVTIFDLETWEEVASFDQKHKIYGVCWPPGGDQIICSTSDFNVFLHDLPSGMQRMEYRGHLSQVVGLRAPGSGRHLFTWGWDGFTRIWHLRSGEKLFEIRGNVSSMSNDGGRLIIEEDSPNAGVWEFTEGSRCFHRFHIDGKPSDKVVSLGFSHDGRWLVGGSGQGLALWDLQTGDELAFAEHSSVRSITFSASDSMSFQASGSSGMHRWKIQQVVDGGGTNRYTLNRSEELTRYNINKHINSPDGSLMAAISGRYVTVIDKATRELSEPIKGQPGINNLAFSPDNKWLAAGCWKGRGARIWEVENPDNWVDLLTNEDVTRCMFTQNGKWLITGNRRAYQIRSVGDWKVVRELPAGGKILLAVDPTGKYIALNLGDDRIELRDGETFEPIAAFRPPSSGAFGKIAFSPDGNHFALGTSTRNFYVWNIPEMRRELSKMGLDWE